MTIQHTDGQTFTLSKSQLGQESFDLQDMPVGKKLAPEIIINRFAAILADVQITSVKNKSSIPAPEGIINATITTFDALRVDMQTFEYEGRPYASFNFQIIDIENESDDKIESADLTKYVDSMNQKLGSWLFEIQGFKFDILKNRTEDLIRNGN